MKRFFTIIWWPFKLRGRQGWKRKVTWFNIVSFLLGISLFGYLSYLDHEPEQFDPVQRAKLRAASLEHRDTMPVGFVTGSTFLHIADVMLNKKGGFISNDLLSPTILMDNVPNWEHGVVIQLREFMDLMRRSVGVSTTAGGKNEALVMAQSKFNIDHRDWIMPSAEGSYREGMVLIDNYLKELLKGDSSGVRFYARADVLDMWLDRVLYRLSALSQDLTSTVSTEPVLQEGEEVDINALPGGIGFQKWNAMDDAFYQTRGECWALYHLMVAVTHDYKNVLQATDTTGIMKQIIQELEYSQMPMFSPIVLGGYKFGLFANHNVSLATYISRAKVAILELRSVLTS